MNQPLITGLTILFVTFGCHAQSTQGQSQNRYRAEVGQLHVDFELPSIDGEKMVKLSDFKGKKLLLFHFASW